MDTVNENVIEFLRGQKTMTCTFCGNSRYATKVRKLAEKYPDEVQIVVENADGSIVAHIPTSYLKISNNKREMTEEQRQANAERLKKSLAEYRSREVLRNENE